MYIGLNKNILLKVISLPSMVAHVCNSSYSGGRDQEDRDSKPALKNLGDPPISTNKNCV
jgi:hypothetical protein